MKLPHNKHLADGLLLALKTLAELDRAGVPAPRHVVSSVAENHWSKPMDDSTIGPILTFPRTKGNR